MNDISKKLREPLSIENVDFRVQTVSPKGYITLLAYKDARVDMQRLNEVVGCMNWKREHTRDNRNCIVSIWDEEKKQWVSKEDTGAESFAEKEKGLASDSFKRACFNWGIGIELYDYPQIFFQLYPDEFKVANNKAKTTFNFQLKKWKWEVEFKDDKVFRLIGKDNNGRLRYDSQKDFNGVPKQPNQTQQKPQEIWLSEEQMSKLRTADKDVITKYLDAYSDKLDKKGNMLRMKKAFREELESLLKK